MMLKYLLPGTRITNGIEKATLITIHYPHPLYPTLALVIWHMDNGEWSFDALNPDMEIDNYFTILDRDLLTDNLRRVLHGRKHISP